MILLSRQMPFSMNYYPVLRSEDLKAQVSLFNFPPIYYGQNRYRSSVNVYSVTSNGKFWKFRKQTYLKAGDFVIFKHSSGELETTFYFMSCLEYPQQLDRLPIEQLKQHSLMGEVAWRSNLKLMSSLATTSYQGEYPPEMLKIKNETLVSICPLIQEEENVINRIYFINLKSTPEIERKKIYLSNVITGQRLETITVFTNQCTEIHVPQINWNMHKQLYLHSDEIAGIPLYFTSNKNFSDFSLEHSQPPSEFHAFGDTDRSVLTKRMKQWWLSRHD